MTKYEYMRIPVKYIPEFIMILYNLYPLVHNGYVMVEIRKGMYGLPQAGILANQQLIVHLAQYGYVPARHTPGLFTHPDRPILFVLTVDNFAVKYVGKEHADHLIQALEAKYKITIDWEGKQYCGLTLDWDYDSTPRTCDISMPGYIERALTRFSHPPPKRPQHSPHAWQAPQYGSASQLTAPEDTSDALSQSGILFLQQVIGTLLYYARAVDSTMLVTINTIASEQAHATKNTMAAVTQLLNYCATHPDATVRFTASDMALKVVSDASYLTASKARSRIGGYFYLGNLPVDATIAPSPDDGPATLNGPVEVNVEIFKGVLASAAEAELGGLYSNAKKAAVLRVILDEMGHPQATTPIQTDNACAAGIANKTVKQRQSRAVNMRFYWIQDRVGLGEFFVYWSRGCDNDADYFTKHHSPSHHRRMRSRYLYEKNRKSSDSLQRGCVDTSRAGAVAPAQHVSLITGKLSNRSDSDDSLLSNTHSVVTS
jgi:hypothetical protein